MNAINSPLRRRAFTRDDRPTKGLADALIRHGDLRPIEPSKVLTSAASAQAIPQKAMLSEDSLQRSLAQMQQTATRTADETAAIDLDRQPPDPRLTKLLGPQDCVAFKVIPWRSQGGVHVLATTDVSAAHAVLRRLPEALKPARFVQASPASLDQAIIAAHGPQLARLAETRAPARLSCRNWSGGKLARLCAAFAIMLIAGLIAAPALVGGGLFWIACATLVLNTVLKAAAMMIALRRQPEKAPEFRRGRSAKPPVLPKISVLVPLFEEANIASLLIDRLARVDYPSALLEICLIMEADDHVTRAAVARTKLSPGMKVITVPRGQLKTKPRAMNYALDFTSGALIGVYDAEDAPDRDQLYKVARRFQDADDTLACVQGVLSFYNPHAGWLARCFAFEYAGWFRVMLPGLQRLGFAIPLGGTTLFFRRDALVELGGWDAHNVTEDADLGIRLARHGYRCEMLDSVTQEEANNRFWPWVKQRSRWLKGYAMTWAVHMRSPRQLWCDLGAWKFAGFQLLFLGTLTAFCLAPVLWWNMVHFLTGGAVLPVAGLTRAQVFNLSMLFMACEAITAALFFVAGRQLTHRPAFAWILTLPAYFAIGTLAAYKGIAELVWKPFFWDKTAHGISPAQAPLQGIGSVDLETGLVGDGQMVFESLGSRTRIPGLDGLNDSEMFIKRDLPATFRSKRGGRQ